MPEHGDPVLLAAARAGDTEAFAVLVKPHLDALHRFATRVGPGPDAADDILQETLLRAWRHLGTFRGDCSWRTWLFSIVWRAAKTEAARLGRAPRPVAEVPETESLEPSPVEQAERRELVGRAIAALRVLPHGQRAAIARVDFGGSSLGSAAAELGVPLGTLKTHLHRGRRRLAALLGRGRTGDA